MNNEKMKSDEELLSHKAEYADEAIEHTNIYCFRYYPERRLMVLPERTSRDFGCERLCRDMPAVFVGKEVLPEDLPAAAKLFEDMDNGEEHSSAEFRIKNGSGIIWCSVTLTAVKKDQNGKTEIVCGILEDCSRIKNREQEFVAISIQSQMMELLSCGVLAYSLPDYKIIIVNKEAKRIAGFDSDDNQGYYEYLVKRIPSECGSGISHAVAEIKRTGEPIKYSFRVARDDGRILAIDCVTKLVSFDGEKKYILSVMQDVSEREKVAALLRRERRQYRDAVTLNSEYSYSFDVTDGMIYSDFMYSKNGSRLTSLFDEPLPIKYDQLQKKWMREIQPVFLTSDDCGRLDAQGLRRRFEQGDTHIGTEYYRPSEGRYYRKNILLSRDDESGHIMAVVYVTDITETMREETRKRNELASANRILRKQVEITGAFSSIYFSSWEIDLRTPEISEISVPRWAHCVAEESGGNYKEAVKVVLREFVVGEYREEMEHFLRSDDMAERLKDRRILTCECMGRRCKWCEAVLIPIRMDEYGNVLKTIFALRDINYEKQVELDSKHALQDAYESANFASEAKTRFLSSMSHDIRTPLNAILGMTAIASAHIDDKDRVSDCLSKITLSGKHLLGLINEVLDMNKIESGKLSLNSEEFSLPELIDSLIAMSASQIESKAHELTVNIRGVSHENVIGDSQRIQQVFMNLMSNAVKYTPDGGRITLTVTEKETKRPKVGCYEFVFEDNGIGMDEKFINKIFEPFTRAKDPRVENMQGTGLGMSITRNIVQMMNGDIKVESKINVGTKITVTIFLMLGGDNDECGDISKFAGCSVLVADDDPLSCESACEMLEELGMKGDFVLTGREAAEKIAARHKNNDDYFAVMIDWKMADMDGIATTKAIRSEVGNDLPIIIISAFNWSDIEFEARAAGANAFISKPLFKSRMAGIFRTVSGHDADTSESSPLSSFSKANFKGYRVLLAEDNGLNSEIAGEILGMAGLEVEYVLDGREAVEKMKSVESGYYDMIFMDIQMPYMNGYEATMAIRKLPGDYPKTVPIVAMTANAFAEDVRTAKNAGMNDHIAKPLNFEQLYKVLTDILGSGPKAKS